VRHIVGEWHTNEGSREAQKLVQRELQTILGPTHEVEFGQDQPGREGRFSARLRAA
jgi:hypothetical protein